MILVFAAALVLAALFYTLFVRNRDIPEPLPVSPVQHLLDRKQAIYDNLRDLQFEYRLGKLSDGDYKQTKLALQKELATILAETDEITKRLGLRKGNAPAHPKPKQTRVEPPGKRCPHCGATFPQALKFCGECGKAMA